MKTIWTIIEKATGKICFASESQTEFVGHKHIKSDKHDRGTYQMTESTLAEINKAKTVPPLKSVFLIESEDELTKKGLLVRLVGNTIEPLTFAVETSNDKITE